MSFVLKLNPFWLPYYFIPLISLILARTLINLSIGVNVFLKSVYENPSLIEDRLARGASAYEAMGPEITSSINVAMTPFINNMRVLGLVAIPGLMTGQILGGVAPELAAKYQLIIFYMNASATTLSVFCAIYLSCHALFDDDGRFCRWKLCRRVQKDVLTSFFIGGKDFFQNLCNGALKRKAASRFNEDEKP
eukprot:CAMPEP_0171470700 /NCGR_PEP_ID=MMETSP0946-20130122/291_1 /TAXON_ID=109269 /ORGANISM="Vaucheria litorea, Strain CCMP2940" /LENGTH=191 /DNA_ID=CAMNT_0012000101 /DNA_START=1193 /DNA_END=1765 /DNA_ORIENTATION=+